MQADFTPTPSGATQPYWDGTKERKLLLQRCEGCDRYVHHPREACPSCLGTNLSWSQVRGTGAIHALTVHTVPFEVMSKEECPYVVAFIDLDEGVRFLSNIVGPTRTDARAGDRVELAWQPVQSGYNLPVFVPTSESGHGHAGN
jgi:uncharacterized OB-fold protein